MKRKSTGKRLRFEIFKRDGFRCVYCGATPVQSVLRIDHVVPVAKGGATNPANLVTACHDCNAGKSDVPLEKNKFTKPILTDAHREHAEQIREYLKIQEEIARARQEVAEEISKHWEQQLGPMTQDMFNRLIGLVRQWPFEKLIEAIGITAKKFSGKYPNRPINEFDLYLANNQAKYFHGVLRKWSEQEQLNGEGA